MSSNNDYGKRADNYSVNNDGMFRQDGTPVLKSAPNGQVVEKEVTYTTSTCPECGTIGRIREKGEVICDDDECAVVISDDPPTSFEEFGQQTHNDSTTMGSSVGGTSASKPAANPAAGTAKSE